MSGEVPGVTGAILLVGPTGSGKTPLGEALDRQGLWGRRCAHFDFGAQLRRVAAGAAGQGILDADEVSVVARVLGAGALLEDAQFPIACKLLRAFIAAKGLLPGDWLALNGLPRHAGQARAVAPVAEVRTVVQLSCRAEVVRERIRRDAGGDRAGRPDDSPGEVERKLRLFEERTLPLVDHYRGLSVRVLTLPVEVETRARDLYLALTAAGSPRRPEKGCCGNGDQG